MTTEDEIRRVLHPEAHEPMRYEPRIPLGCDQQGRHPQVAEPCVDLDELGVKLPPQEPWWPYILGAVVGLLALVLVFAPLGV
jgi:hypothetical protein